MDTWILSERVLCPDFVERPLGLHVVEGRIAELVSLEEARFKATDAHDFQSCPVVPAWVNAHVHLGMAPLRGITTRAARRGNVVTDVFFQVEQQMTAQDVLAFARLGAYESLICGCVEVWDHYYFGEATAQALLEVGLTGNVAPTLQDLFGPGSTRTEAQLEATFSIARNQRYARAGISASVGIHALDTVSPHLLTRAGRVARDLHIPMHMHLLQNFEEVLQANQRYQRDPVGELLSRLGDADLLVAHALHASTSEVEQLCHSGARLAFCPLSQSQFGFLGPLEAWLDHQGRWAIGTDTVASNDSLDVQRELSLLAGLPGLATSFSAAREKVLKSGNLQANESLEKERKALSLRNFPVEPEAILRAAWGLDLPGGPRGITKGANANLLVLEANHPALFPPEALPRALACGSLTTALRQVFARGRPLGEEGRLCASLMESPAYQSTLTECRARTREILERIS